MEHLLCVLEKDRTDLEKDQTSHLLQYSPPVSTHESSDTTGLGVALTVCFREGLDRFREGLVRFREGPDFTSTPVFTSRLYTRVFRHYTGLGAAFTVCFREGPDRFREGPDSTSTPIFTSHLYTRDFQTLLSQDLVEHLLCVLKKDRTDLEKDRWDLEKDRWRTSLKCSIEN